MGILIETLRAKYSLKTPPLALEAGIRQESQLDYASNLSFDSLDEMDAHIYERLEVRESEALLQLSDATTAGRMAFPLPIEQASLLMPSHTPEQRAAVLQFQLTTAAEAVEKAVLGDLYFKAANRNPEIYTNKYLQLLGDKSSGRPGDADLTLKKVITSITGLMANADRGAQGASNRLRSNVMVRTEPDETTEYRGPDTCIPDPIYVGRTLGR